MSQYRRLVAARVPAFSFSAVLLLGVLNLAAAPLAAQQCEGANAITRLGGANRFSPPVEDVDALQALFVDHREEIVALLAEANWQGAAEDLFVAVASGEGVSRTSFDPGQRLEWMVFRNQGTATVGTNMCWNGSEAFASWEIRFESDGVWYSMIVPVACGNLALLAEQPLPELTLDVGGLNCSEKTFDIETSCANGEAVVTVRMPDGSERRVDAGSASVPFMAEGDYVVSATCSATSPRGDSLQSRSTATFAAGCPSCTLTGTPAAHDLGASSTLQVRPNAGHGAEIRRVLLDGELLEAPYSREMTHDGADAFTHTATVETSAGQSAQCSTEMKVAPTITMSAEPERMLAGSSTLLTVMPNNGAGAPVTVTLDEETLAVPYTREIVHRQEGSYTHTARVENPGGANEASVDVKVDPRWSLLVTMSDIGGDDAQSDIFEGASQTVRACQQAVGFGLAAEYKVNYRLGIMVGANMARCEVLWDYAVDGLSGRDMADLDTDLVYAGLNFHLTRPGQRVDLWVGPMIGRFDYDSPTLTAVEDAGMPFDATYRPQWQDETVFGLNLGLEIPFIRDCPAGFFLGAMWIDSTLEAGAATIGGLDGANAPGLSLDRGSLYLNAGISIDF